MSTVLYFVLVLSILEACAQNSLKQCELYGSPWMLVLGLAMYICVGFVLRYTYKTSGLGVVNLFWACLSIIFGLSAGYFIYGEKMNTYTIYAVLLSLAAIAMAILGLEYPDV